MTIWRMRIACKVYKHTLRTCNTYSFSTVTMATRKHPQLDVIRTLSVLCTFIGCHCCIRLWVTEEFRDNLSQMRPTLCAKRKLFSAFCCCLSCCCKFMLAKLTNPKVIHTYYLHLRGSYWNHEISFYILPSLLNSQVIFNTANTS
jgi:hypothetical protein